MLDINPSRWCRCHCPGYLGSLAGRRTGLLAFAGRSRRFAVRILHCVFGVVVDRLLFRRQ